MKKFFFLLSLLVFASSAHAQPHEQLQALEHALQSQGFGVSHTRRTGRGIDHQWRSSFYQSNNQPRLSEELWQKMSEAEQKALLHNIDSFLAAQKQRQREAIDLVRTTISNLAAEASESYMYEVHNQECDTIRLSMAWRDGQQPLQTWRGDGGVHYGNAREAVSLQFERAPGSDDTFGQYVHIYTEDYPEPMGNIKSFDAEKFQASIVAPCLKRALKLKGARKYPVYWRHDAGYQEEVGDELIYKVMRQSSYGDNKHTGLTTGDLIFIPKAFEAEANALLATLDSLTYGYVTAHYDQDHTYHFNPRFAYGNAVTLVSGSNWPDHKPVDTEYLLSIYCDEAGYYVLSVVTEGELWMPRNFVSLKSWVNGTRVERKP